MPNIPFNSYFEETNVNTQPAQWHLQSSQQPMAYADLRLNSYSTKEAKSKKASTEEVEFTALIKNVKNKYNIRLDSFIQTIDANIYKNKDKTKRTNIETFSDLIIENFYFNIDLFVDEFFTKFTNSKNGYPKFGAVPIVLQAKSPEALNEFLRLSKEFVKAELVRDGNVLFFNTRDSVSLFIHTAYQMPCEKYLEKATEPFNIFKGYYDIITDNLVYNAGLRNRMVNFQFECPDIINEKYLYEFTEILSCGFRYEQSNLKEFLMKMVQNNTLRAWGETNPAPQRNTLIPQENIPARVGNRLTFLEQDDTITAIGRSALPTE